ncbi:MAG TPA: DUF2254 domain-containing protein [Candidatus Angelobacter sp.]|nr:DUF2254 domain-containing protein [Candidatus Angelobacter sp.]
MRMLSQSQRVHLGPWLIPGLYAVTAIAASMILPRIEHYVFPHLKAEASIEASIAIYSSIASGMMALTGIVFSLTLLMVQFSATAYSPRLVMWIARDPVLSHALGVFSATFLYAIAALEWLDRNSSRKVPFISSLVVIVLLLTSVGMFVGLIHRIGRLQINRMLIFTGDRGREVIEKVYGPLGLSSNKVATGDFRTLIPEQTLLHHGEPRSLESVNVNRLVKLAKQHDACIKVVTAVGDTVLEGTPLLQIFNASHSFTERELSKVLELGGERTFEQDPKYAIRLLVDIAIRALSPAINDPTTAVQALDQIGDLLLRLGGRRLEIGPYPDDSGRIRLIVPFPSWDDFLHLGFEEILSYGAKSVQIMRRMKALITDLLAVLPPERHAGLKYWQERLTASIIRSFEDAEEKLSAFAEDRQGLGVTRSSAA